jgi:hypothetical protein
MAPPVAPPMRTPPSHSVRHPANLIFHQSIVTPRPPSSEADLDHLLSTLSFLSELLPQRPSTSPRPSQPPPPSQTASPLPLLLEQSPPPSLLPSHEVLPLPRLPLLLLRPSVVLPPHLLRVDTYRSRQQRISRRRGRLRRGGATSMGV